MCRCVTSRRPRRAGAGQTRRSRQPIAAARVWVPILVGIMAGAFTAYLAMKGLKQLVEISTRAALLLGLLAGFCSWLLMIPVTRRQSEGLENRNKSLKVLFGIPLVASAALLSFAHGANDVANAVGPLAGGWLLFHVAFLPIPPNVARRFRTDLSYGVYLYAYPIQQSLVHWFSIRNPALLFLLALPITLAAAWLSWTLVERRFLALKQRTFSDSDPAARR